MPIRTNTPIVIAHFAGKILFWLQGCQKSWILVGFRFLTYAVQIFLSPLSRTLCPGWRRASTVDSRNVGLWQWRRALKFLSSSRDSLTLFTQQWSFYISLLSTSRAD